jgi:hypothetical protein
MMYPHDGTDEPMVFFLIESKASDQDKADLKRTLDDTNFASEFTSVEECKEWMLREQGKKDLNTMEENLIYVADERSAKDGTLAAYAYSDEPIMLGLNEDQPMPPEANTWYEFRVKYQDAMVIQNHYVDGEPGDAWPILFGPREKITDKNGVLNAKKLQQLIDNSNVLLLIK